MIQGPSSFKLLPDVIKNLLIINGLFFLATVVLAQTGIADLIHLLGLHLPNSPSFQPYQIITHMFMHGGLMHVALNMFALWMFGYTLENVWGSKRFLIYYLITGLGAAALHLGITYFEYSQIKDQLSAQELNLIFTQGADLIAQNQNYTDPVLRKANGLLNGPTVGASGAVFGILLAFGMMFPNQYIYLYFAIPVKAKYFVMGYAAFELFRGIQNDPSSNVAHFAHLGGMLFGYLLIRYWRSSGNVQHY